MLILCAYNCVQLWYTVQHWTFQIIFSLVLQTNHHSSDGVYRRGGEVKVYEKTFVQSDLHAGCHWWMSNLQVSTGRLCHLSKLQYNEESAQHLVLHGPAHDQIWQETWPNPQFSNNPRCLQSFLERIRVVTHPLTWPGMRVKEHRKVFDCCITLHPHEYEMTTSIVSSKLINGTGKHKFKLTRTLAMWLSNTSAIIRSKDSSSSRKTRSWARSCLTVSCLLSVSR